MASVSVVPSEGAFSNVNVAGSVKPSVGKTPSPWTVLERVLSGQDKFYSWTVFPGVGLGPYIQLGVGLTDCLCYLQNCGSLNDVQLSYDIEFAHNSDVVVRLPELGINQCFEAITQRLHSIIFLLDDSSGDSSILST